MTRWKRLKLWWQRKQHPLTGRTVDFRQRHWGHNLECVGGTWWAWSTPPLQHGDVILTERGRFIITGVRPQYHLGPNDMVEFSCRNLLKLYPEGVPERPAK
jgi:hypothetical protein